MVRWLLLVLLVVVVGSGGDEEPAVEAPPSIRVKSDAFKQVTAWGKAEILRGRPKHTVYANE